MITARKFESQKDTGQIYADINLNVLQDHMKSVKFYGTITILWQDGNIILIREERTIRPFDFGQLLSENSF